MDWKKTENFICIFVNYVLYAKLPEYFKIKFGVQRCNCKCLLQSKNFNTSSFYPYIEKMGVGAIGMARLFSLTLRPSLVPVILFLNTPIRYTTNDSVVLLLFLIIKRLKCAQLTLKSVSCGAETNHLRSTNIKMYAFLSFF